MTDYRPAEVEPKWQRVWVEKNVFKTPELPAKSPSYVLDMFPYPSGSGLHVGHVKGYIATDVYARCQMMRGSAVLHPMGWDAFGLPAENYAIANKVHPRQAVEKNIARFKEQLSRIGFTYDWSREITTTDPAYYRWTQWIFVQLFRAGLAYESNEPINWCPSCKTGLANEDVEDGRCERCGTLVEQRPMRQWMLKIRTYADKLLAGLDELAWPESIKALQRNWIGRSEGAEIEFPILNSQFSIRVFTTRPDTLFGATYMVVAPEHPIVASLLNSKSKIKNAKEVEAYIRAAERKTNLMRQEEERDKTGVIIEGVAAVNPANEEEIPVWVADYVLIGYGTGAIMAVPAHDERDFAFAQKFKLPVRCVIEPAAAFLTGSSSQSLEDAEKNWKQQLQVIKEGQGVYVGPGKLMNSTQKFNGLDSEEAKKEITKWLAKQGKGKAAVDYKMRDWVFSRQRYWGEPIPIIHCERCGAVPVPEEDLPVTLPEVEHYEPTGTGESPLANIAEWVNVVCPTCTGPAQRETNTMPQWAGSSWYYLRYIDPRNGKELVAPKKEQAWMPVSVYVGGAEHATRHLIYARFWHKFLFDQGVVSTPEPFDHLYNVGLIGGADGRKMSKRWGNVVNPDDVIDRFGADTLRVYEMFMGPFAASAAWDESSIAGAHRFLRRVWHLAQNASLTDSAVNADTDLLLQRTIKRVTDGIELFRFNTAIAALMELLNALEAALPVTAETMSVFVRLLAPFAPHLAEELWLRLGHEDVVMQADWPAANKKTLAAAAVTVAVQVDGKVRGEVTIARSASQTEAEAAARELNNVAKYLDAGTVKKVVYVEGRLINFVMR